MKHVNLRLRRKLGILGLLLGVLFVMPPQKAHALYCPYGDFEGCMAAADNNWSYCRMDCYVEHPGEDWCLDDCDTSYNSFVDYCFNYCPIGG